MPMHEVLGDAIPGGIPVETNTTVEARLSDLQTQPGHHVRSVLDEMIRTKEIKGYSVTGSDYLVHFGEGSHSIKIAALD